MKKTALLLFLAVCLIQWFVPAKMIWDQEQLYKTGTAFKLRTVPVDPNDPFRGKYITLNYDINNYLRESVEDLGLEAEINVSKRTKVYVTIKNDEEGFAQIVDLSTTPPTSPHYLTAQISSYHKSADQYRIQLQYPFQKFFMEESKAPKAEELYRDALRHTDQQVYAIVNVDKGNAVLIDVQVDGTSIKDLVETYENKEIQ